MAEVLGVVASVIAVGQLAGKVAKTIIKLNECWEQVKDVPAEIESQLQLLSAFNRILCNIRDAPSNPGPSEQPFDIEYLQECCKICQAAVDDLKGLIDRQQSKLHAKQGWKKKGFVLKIVLQKEDIKRLKGKMKIAVQLLQLALMWRTNAMMELQSTMIISRLDQGMADILSSTQNNLIDTSRCCEEVIKDNTLAVHSNINYSLGFSSLRNPFGTLCYAKNRYIRNGKTQQETIITYYLPFWLSKNVWHWRQYEKYSAWRMVLQVSCIVPSDSPFFKFVRQGNIEGIRKMLANKEALISDVEDTWGCTALHIAANHGNIDVCKLLLEQGANPLARNNFNLTILHWLPYCVYSDNVERIARLLVCSGAGEQLVDDLSTLIYSRSPATFLYLRDEIYPPYHTFPADERLSVLQGVAQYFNDNALLMMMEYAIGIQGLDSELIHASTGNGFTLLHVIGQSLWCCTWDAQLKEIMDSDLDNYSSAQNDLCGSRHVKYMLQYYCKLLEQCVIAGANLHPLDDRGNTPLFTMINPSIIDGMRCDPLTIPKLIRHWIDVLFARGVDLQQYGETEKKHHLARRQEDDCWNNSHPYECWHLYSRNCTGFKYGPRPENWYFWFAEPSDCLVGEFWDRIENSVCFDDEKAPVLPGAWVDD